MTYQIRHHTTRADANARKCQPSVALAKFDKAPDGEAVLGLQMALLARREGKRGKAPSIQASMSGRENNEIEAAILKVIDGEMTTRQITDAVSQKLRREVSIKTIGGKLRGPLFHRLAKSEPDGGFVYWSLK